MEREQRNKQFSVLMSVYKKDNPLYLREAIESCFSNQKTVPREIILVQDGVLTEDLYKEIESLISKYKEITTVPLEQNVGLGAALRIGVGYCQCELIARLDSDDINAPDRFHKQLQEFEKDNELEVVGMYIEEFNIHKGDSKIIREVPVANSEILKYIKKRNPMNHVTVMMRKSSLLRAGNYETVMFVEDYYLWIKMIGLGIKLKNIPQVGVYVRTGIGMTMRRSNKEYIKSWKILQKKLLENKNINKFESFLNMVYIYCFVNTPVWLKSIIYSKFLRKKY